MLVINCKIKIKQALCKHKCDKVLLNMIICIESLTAKFIHSVYHSNTLVYSKKHSLFLDFLMKGVFGIQLVQDCSVLTNQSFPVMWYKCRQAQHMCNMFTLS